MSDDVDHLLRDGAHPFRTSDAEPAGGLADALRRSRSRRRTRHALRSGTAVVVLLVAAAGVRLGTTESVTTVPAAPPSTIATTAPGAAPSTAVPVTSTSEGPQGETTTTSTPTTTRPPTTTTPPTTAPTAGGVVSFGPDGLMGVTLGMPVDEAIGRISSQIGSPDRDENQDDPCSSANRFVSWGVITIAGAGTGPHATVRSIGYQSQPDLPVRAIPLPTVLIGGQVPFYGPPRPYAQVLAAVAAALPDHTATPTSDLTMQFVKGSQAIEVQLRPDGDGVVPVTASLFTPNGMDVC